MIPTPRWERVKELFDQAAALTSGHRRAAFLDEACVGDAGLRREVESLLASDEAAHGFLEPLEAERDVSS